MIKFLDKKLFRYISVFLFLNSSILPVKSSSALAAWAINDNGVLELRKILKFKKINNKRIIIIIFKNITLQVSYCLSNFLI